MYIIYYNTMLKQKFNSGIRQRIQINNKSLSNTLLSKRIKTNQSNRDNLSANQQKRLKISKYNSIINQQSLQHNKCHQISQEYQQKFINKQQNNQNITNPINHKFQSNTIKQLLKPVKYQKTLTKVSILKNTDKTRLLYWNNNVKITGKEKYVLVSVDMIWDQDCFWDKPKSSIPTNRVNVNNKNQSGLNSRNQAGLNNNNNRYAYSSSNTLSAINNNNNFNNGSSNSINNFGNNALSLRSKNQISSTVIINSNNTNTNANANNAKFRSNKFVNSNNNGSISSLNMNNFIREWKSLHKCNDMVILWLVRRDSSYFQLVEMCKMYGLPLHGVFYVKKKRGNQLYDINTIVKKVYEKHFQAKFLGNKSNNNNNVNNNTKQTKQRQQNNLKKNYIKKSLKLPPKYLNGISKLGIKQQNQQLNNLMYNSKSKILLLSTKNNNLNINNNDQNSLNSINLITSIKSIIGERKYNKQQQSLKSKTLIKSNHNISDYRNNLTNKSNSRQQQQLLQMQLINFKSQTLERKDNKFINQQSEQNLNLNQDNTKHEQQSNVNNRKTEEQSSIKHIKHKEQSDPKDNNQLAQECSVNMNNNNYINIDSNSNSLNNTNQKTIQHFPYIFILQGIKCNKKDQYDKETYHGKIPILFKEHTDHYMKILSQIQNQDNHGDKQIQFKQHNNINKKSTIKKIAQNVKVCYYNYQKVQQNHIQIINKIVNEFKIIDPNNYNNVNANNIYQLQICKNTKIQQYKINIITQILAVKKTNTDKYLPNRQQHSLPLTQQQQTCLQQKTTRYLEMSRRKQIDQIISLKGRGYQFQNGVSIHYYVGDIFKRNYYILYDEAYKRFQKEMINQKKKKVTARNKQVEGNRKNQEMTSQQQQKDKKCLKSVDDCLNIIEQVGFYQYIVAGSR